MCSDLRSRDENLCENCLYTRTGCNVMGINTVLPILAINFVNFIHHWTGGDLGLRCSKIFPLEIVFDFLNGIIVVFLAEGIQNLTFSLPKSTPSRYQYANILTHYTSWINLHSLRKKKTISWETLVMIWSLG